MQAFLREGQAPGGEGSDPEEAGDRSDNMGDGDSDFDLNGEGDGGHDHVGAYEDGFEVNEEDIPEEVESDYSDDFEDARSRSDLSLSGGGQPRGETLARGDEFFQPSDEDENDNFGVDDADNLRADLRLPSGSDSLQEHESFGHDGGEGHTDEGPTAAAGEEEDQDEGDFDGGHERYEPYGGGGGGGGGENVLPGGDGHDATRHGLLPGDDDFLRRRPLKVRPCQGSVSDASRAGEA